MHSPTVRNLTALAALAGTATALAPAPAAHACGGFFCSQVPVDQMGEQIIFGMKGDTITAQILINYTGDAEDFAWLLPVASTPEISLGTLNAFQQLGWRTNPSFDVDWKQDSGTCGMNWWRLSGEVDYDAPQASPGDPGVEVLSKKDVGPFETVVLSSRSTDDLVKWLDENDYDQPPESIPLLDHYVRQDMQFVALRLKKDEPTGAIQPITLTFREADPCVPLVLTQVAAVPNMPVQLYLFADHRVVPTNWFHVTVNERRIDWIQYGQNYKDLVNQAIDEAAGHGFVTEFAGSTDLTKNIVYREGQYDTADLARTTNPALFVDKLLTQGFPRDAVMQQLLREFIPMPQALADQGVSEPMFYNNLDMYADALAGQPFDPAAFVDALEERVITPLRETKAIFDAHPKLTRLYTTVSEDEMNRDPVFAENPDLPDVSNRHLALGEVSCDGETIQTIRVTLTDGTVIEYQPSDEWPYAIMPPELLEEPAAGRIELVGRSGPPVLVDPEKAEGIDAVLNSQAPESVLIEVAKEPFVPPTRPNQIPSVSASGGCAGGPALPFDAAMVLLVTWLGLEVRRRLS